MTGRAVMSLGLGTNDVSRLAPGLYFVREQPKLNYHEQTTRAVAIVK